MTAQTIWDEFGPKNSNREGERVLRVTFGTNEWDLSPVLSLQQCLDKILKIERQHDHDKNLSYADVSDIFVVTTVSSPAARAA